MTGVDLVGLDAEALADDAPQPFGREQAIFAAEKEPDRHIGPFSQQAAAATPR